MESLVKLTVKTPNQGIDDIQVNCELDWTVRKLKEYLQDVYPSKPSSSSQKLIYLGRLLQDHLSLKEVFGEWGARTLHIVCSESAETMTATTTSSSTATPTTTSASSSNIPGMDGLRFRGFSSSQGLPSNQSVPVAASMPSMFPQYASTAAHMPSSSQYYQMQAQYALQYQQQMQLYYQQWYQWQQAMGGGQFPYNHFLPDTNPNTTQNISPETSHPAQVIDEQYVQQTPQPGAQQPVQESGQQSALQPQPAQQPLPDQQPQPNEQPQPDQPPQPDVAPNPPNQNIRMNAGPGGVGINDGDDDQENPRNRDWLDWLYTSLRAFMLLSIVYFYSSTSRFIMVTILAFLLYLYQNGWFTPRRIPVPVDEPLPNVPNGERDEANGQQNNPELADVNNDLNMATQEPLQNEPPRPSPLRVLCTFFVSFVTSLIPNPPAIPAQ